MRAVRALLVLALLSAAALAGCGGSSGNGVASKSAREILAASTAAAEAASSVHIAGASAQGLLKLALDLQLSREAGHSQLDLLGTKFEVIRTGDTIYVKGSRRFYRQLGLDPTRIPTDTWVKVPNVTTRSAQLASLATLHQETRQLLTTTGAVTKGASTTIDGQPVIELKTNGRLYSGAIYVDTTGDPYPLQIVKKGRESSRITFSGWNEPISLSPPGQVVDITRLEHKGG